MHEEPHPLHDEITDQWLADLVSDLQPPAPAYEDDLQRRLGERLEAEVLQGYTEDPYDESWFEQEFDV